jgi:DNA transformation protein
LGNEFVEFVLEGLQPLGGVRARRMFGGWGIYKDGLMFALIARDQLYLKVDDDNRAAYDAADLPYFTYSEKGKPIRMSYREAPGAGLDDPEVLCEWARAAYAAALRTRQRRQLVH